MQGKEKCPNLAIEKETFDFDQPAYTHTHTHIQCTPSLPSLHGPPWPGEVAPDVFLSMDQIEVFDLLNV